MLLPRYQLCALLSGVLAIGGASAADAKCIERGVYYKETYCFGGSDPEYLPPLEYAPSIDEQVSALLATANAHISEGNTLAAWVEIETALRLNPADANALALQARLNQILAEVQRRNEEEAQRAAIQKLKEEAEQLAQAGQAREAMEVIRRARDLAPYDIGILSTMLDIKQLMLEPALRRDRQDDAANKAAYEAAKRNAQGNTSAELNRLADRLQGPAWRQLTTAVKFSSEAESLDSPVNASGLLQIPFDQVDGLLSGPALDLLSGSPRAVPVEPTSVAERGRRLVTQIDYWEGQQRKLGEAMAGVTDGTMRRELERNIDIINGITAVARVKLINLSVSTPSQQ